MTADRTNPRWMDAKSFDDFRAMAQDASLSRYQKIGFPDSYRAGREGAIFADIVAKLPVLQTTGAVVVDVGPGCSDLPRMLIALSVQQGHSLILVDSREMLDLLPDRPGVEKIEGPFPGCMAGLHPWVGRVDALITYSVVQYEFLNGNVFGFVDAVASMLAPRGRALVGDIPNASRRRRFLASTAGLEHHRTHVADPRAVPEVQFGTPTPGEIDDAVILGIIARQRSAGFDAWIMPQDAALSMATRREDMLIERP